MEKREEVLVKNNKSEKIKKEKRVKTLREKKRSRKKALIITATVAILIGFFFIIIAIINAAGYSNLLKYVETFDKVVYADPVLVPEVDTDGYHTFTTDGEFKVLQLTDIHLGAGAFSFSKDKKAINAVAAMITAEKPDLVVFTGDVVYPVPVQAGTGDNLKGSTAIAKLMEELGVYWTIVFGNHDTESYSKYDRAAISAFYEKDEFEHCLFQSGPEDIDGFGNSIIKVKRTNGLVSQALVMIDSQAYVPGSFLGLDWKYDNIHQNQVDWYEEEILALNQANTTLLSTLLITNPDDFSVVKSLMFFHIPLKEMKTAYDELVANNYQNTTDVKYWYGSIHEKDPGIYPGEGEDNMFEKIVELGSTKGMFYGHDHVNNLSIEYQGVRMTYGKSIDYLAYAGIDKLGMQRGCTVITIDGNGNSTWNAENYYQDKYPSKYPKEEVTMQWETDQIIIPEQQ